MSRENVELFLDGRGWFRTSDLSRVKRGTNHRVTSVGVPAKRLFRGEASRPLLATG
jgi:hypothetical protein